MTQINNSILLTSSQYQQHYDYWVRKASGYRSGFRFNGARTGVHGPKAFESVTFSLERENLEILGKMTKASDPEIFVVLLSSFCALFYKYASGAEITLDTPLFRQAGTGELGEDTVPLIQEVSGSATLKDLVLAVNQCVTESYKYQNYPVKEVARAHHASFGTNVCFRYDRVHPAPVADPAAYDLRINVTRNGGLETLAVELTYNVALYESWFVRNLWLHFNRVLACFGNTSVKVDSIPVLTAAETDRLLRNGTAVAYPAGQTVDGVFEQQVRNRPAAVALRVDGRRLTYREVDDKANALAHHLRQSCGVGPKDIVGLLLDRSEWMIISMLAVLKAGAAYLPIDPSYPDDRIACLLADADAKVLILESGTVFKVAGYGGNLLAIDVQFDALGSQAEAPQKNHQPSDWAYVIYTSGSTGKPKGVPVPHQALLNTQYWRKDFYGFTEAFITLQLASFSFDSSVNDVFSMLLWGGQLVILNNEDRLNALKIKACIADCGITNFNIVPSLYGPLLEEMGDDPCQLRLVTLAGEKLTQELVAAHFRKFPGVPIINEYGPTENAICSTACRVRSAEDFDGSIGKPIANHQACVLNDALELLPVGVAGQVCVSGAGLAPGYLNKPELTAARFVDHPYLPGQKLYLTGDLGRWMPGGNLEFLGRKDNQVKIRGFRVELDEIEGALLHHPLVKTAVVAVEEQGRTQSLVAYVVGIGRGSLPVDELRAYLGNCLPAYMVPAQYVRLDAMPLTPHGKIDRKALQQLKTDDQDRQFVPPVNALEQLLVDTWEAVLGRGSIGTGDDFFWIGGDSIKAIQIASRMHQAGYKVEVRDLFEHTRIADLALAIKPLDRVVNQEAVVGRIALTPIQWELFAENGDTAHHYNQAVLLDLPEGSDTHAVRAVFGKLQEHHDALRITFRREDGQWVQLNNAADYPLSLVTYDFRDASDVWERVERAATSLQAGIDLESGPLMKLALFRTAEGDKLLVVVHHLVVDGVSWRILLEDAGELFGQYRKGQPLQLPSKTDSFLAWAANLQVYAHSAPLLAEKEYWAAVDQDATGPIPTDGVATDNCVKDAGSLSFGLSDGETEQLLTQVNRAFNTEINDILLTALSLAAKEALGKDELLVALEGHGREDTGGGMNVSRTVGWFTSVFPVRLRLAAAPGLGRQIKEIKETLRMVPNKGIGYGILKYLAGAGGLPLEGGTAPEISFNYLGQFGGGRPDGQLAVADGPLGVTRHPDGHRKYKLEMLAMIADGQLTLTVKYNTRQFRAQTLERFAEVYRAALSKIIAYCANAGRTELTPSDLTYQGLTLESLAALSERYELLDVYPLSPMQEGILFHALYDRSSRSYFEQITYQLNGPLEPGLVEKSVNELIRRHQVLRTAFVHDDARQPLQVLLKERRVEMHFEDIRHQPRPEQESYLRGFKDKDAARSFDLGHDVLMRVAVFRKGDDTYELVWSHHHIIMDGWCSAMLLAEYSRIYRGFLSGAPAQLPPAGQYRSYIKWLEKLDKQTAAAYWAAYLEGYNEVTGVPKKVRGTGEAGAYRHETAVFVLPENISRKLKESCATGQITLNTLMHTLWGVLLGKYNGKRDVVFGAVVAGRPAEVAGVETTIGLFINTVPVRVKWQAGTSLGELARQVQRKAVESDLHKYHSLADIQALSTLGNGLLDHLLIFQNFPVENRIMEAAGVTPEAEEPAVSGVEVFEQTNYDLNVTIAPATEIRFVLRYNGAVYDRETVRQLENHFVQLAGQAGETPEMPLSELDVLTAPERERLLNGFNRTDSAYPRNKSVHGWFGEQVERTPDRVALVYGAKALSYRGLDDAGNRLAAYLQRVCGLQPDDVVALMVDRSEYLMPGILGILKAGAAYLPLDPAFPVDRLNYIVQDSGAKLLLTQDKYAGLISTSVPAICFETCNFSPGDATPAPVAVGPENLMYVIYTSGSTGQPKGVEITHQSVANFLASMTAAPGLGAADTLLALTTYSFDISVLELLLPGVNGAKLCLPSQEKIQDPARVADLLALEKATVVQATPSMWSALIENGWEGSGGVKVLCGGERLTPELGAKLRQRATSLWNLYGPTETTIWSTLKQIECEADCHTIGRPINNTKIYILDADLNPVPVGITGTLYIGGEGLARGYRDRPALTAEKFIANPFATRLAERMYNTGDLARWLPNGDLFFVGRKDGQVKIRGYRVEVGEIEAKLRQHPAVLEAVVMAREKHGERYLAGYFVSREALSVSALRSHLKALLPEYMIPVAWMALPAFPLTPNGKINREVLPEPDAAAATTGQAECSPVGPTEEKLLQIWKNVLRKDRIGTGDDFFEVGGHSLKATQVAYRVHKELGVKIELKTIFQFPVLADLAAVVDRSLKETYEEIRPLPARPHYEASHAQKRIWLMNQFAEERAAYHLAYAYVFEGPLDRRALEQAFDLVIGRHESLRTVFVLVDGELRQKILSPGAAPFRLEAATPAGADDWMTQAAVLARQEAAAPFDLENGPLLRARLITAGTDKWVFLLTLHHIISDKWSMGVLVKEIFALYRACKHNHENPLPPLRVQYKDYAAWENQQLSGVRLDRHRHYWLEQFRTPVQPLSLPTDYPRPPVKTTRAEKITFRLEPPVSQALKEVSGRANTTLFMTLLAGLHVLLSRYGKGGDVVVGSPIACRNHADLEDQIGLYLNTLALRARVVPEETFAALLDRVKTSTLEAYQYQLYPFDSLVEALGMSRSTSHSPLFDVGFTWQNVDDLMTDQDEATLEDVAATPLAADFNQVKTDFWLHGWEAGEAVCGTFLYNADLYKRSTIERIIDNFNVLLRAIGQNADTPVANLVALLDANEKSKRTMTQDATKAKNLEKFFTVQKKQLQYNGQSLVSEAPLRAGQSYPLVITPGVEDLVLTEWVTRNKKLVQTKMQDCGALLFRGFRVKSIQSFRAFAAALGTGMRYMDQSSPRSLLDENVYTSTTHPADQLIHMHNELSYSADWPMQILFYCDHPAESGGETPLVDSRSMLDLLPQATVDRFAAQGIQYTRNLIDGFGLSWRDVYQTSDKDEVEAYCRRHDILFSWYGDQHLKVSWKRAAIRRHPVTGERVWFNHGFFFNAFNLPEAVKAAVGSEDNYPFNTCYGDGTPIETHVLQTLGQAYERLKVSFSWQQGDILLLDNMLMAHGRHPYAGERRIAVAMNDAYQAVTAARPAPLAELSR